jgi:hypothetical protein
MDYFGINELSELPTPKDFSHEGDQIGEDREIEEPVVNQPSSDENEN